MANRFQVVGLVRFSVLTPTYYSERFASLDETAQHLFSRHRLSLRFRLFETLCLPSLTRQSDKGFQVVVLTAETLPPDAIARLRALIDPHPNIHLRPVGTQNHYRLLKQGYRSLDIGDATHRVMFRLDDDDALDLGFVARLRDQAMRLSDLVPGGQPFALSGNRGFYLDMQGTESEVFDTCERAPLSAGTVLVAPVAHGDNPYRYNHRKLAQHYPLFSDISQPAFLRTIHGDNKSKPAQMGLTNKMTEPEIDASLRRHFGLSVAQLKAL